jgi:hypothetical protein
MIQLIHETFKNNNMKKKLQQALQQLMDAAKKYHEKYPEVSATNPQDDEWTAAWENAETVLMEANMQ